MTATELEGRFSSASAELVQHATRELAYGEQFQVAKMSGSAGNTLVDVYSFPQLVNLMFGTKWDELMIESSKANLLWVDTGRLISWLRDVVGDAEFADAVAESLATSAEHYRARMEAIAPLFRERVGQYRAVLESLEDDAR